MVLRKSYVSNNVVCETNHTKLKWDVFNALGSNHLFLQNKLNDDVQKHARSRIDKYISLLSMYVDLLS